MPKFLGVNKMETDPIKQLRQQNALHYLQVALYELADCCKDEQYNQLIKGLNVFTRPLEAILSDLEKVKL
jgi:hypothetical protein